MPQRPVQAVIGSQDLLSAPRATTVADAARLMKLRNFSAILVVDTKGKLAGIFTERDALFRVIAERRDPKTTRVGDVMTANVRTITPDRPFALALLTMHEGGFRHLPVVYDGVPVGMVTARDALGLEWREFEIELARREHLGESIG
jgi:CBS domain-containing protein